MPFNFTYIDSDTESLYSTAICIEFSLVFELHWKKTKIEHATQTNEITNCNFNILFHNG